MRMVWYGSSGIWYMVLLDGITEMWSDVGFYRWGCITSLICFKLKMFCAGQL